jgi:hypothetical protein
LTVDEDVDFSLILGFKFSFIRASDEADEWAEEVEWDENGFVFETDVATAIFPAAAFAGGGELAGINHGG